MGEFIILYGTLSRADDLAVKCRKLREERRNLEVEKQSLEKSIRAELSLADSDSVSLPLEQEYENLTESFMKTYK